MNIKNKIIKLCVLFSFLLVPLVFFTVEAFATDMSYLDGLDPDAQVILKNFELFEQNWFGADILRFIEWKLILLLRWGCSGCVQLYKSTFGLIDFLDYDKVSKFVEDLSIYVVPAILAISLAVYGVFLIVKKNKMENIFHSILVAFFCVLGLSATLVTLNGLVKTLCEDIAQFDSMEDKIILDDVYDLYYLDNQVGLANLDESNREHNYYEDIDFLDINAVMNYENDDLSEGAQRILSGEFNFMVVGRETEYTYETRILSWRDDVYNGLGWNSGEDTDMFNSFYYRYSFKPFPIIVKLAAYIVVYLCIAYKTARLLFELVFKRIIAMLYSADVNGTQKTVKILSSIKDTYIMLIVGAIMIRLFETVCTFISNEMKVSSFVECMLIIFVALAVADGPNLIQSLTGEDAGLNSTFGKLYALSKVAASPLKVAKEAMRTAGGIHRSNRIRKQDNKKADKRADKMVDSFKQANAKNPDVKEDTSNNLDGKNAADKNEDIRSAFAANNKSAQIPRNIGNTDVSNNANDINENGINQSQPLDKESGKQNKDNKEEKRNNLGSVNRAGDNENISNLKNNENSTNTSNAKDETSNKQSNTTLDDSDMDNKLNLSNNTPNKQDKENLSERKGNVPEQPGKENLSDRKGSVPEQPGKENLSDRKGSVPKQPGKENLSDRKGSVPEQPGKESLSDRKGSIPNKSGKEQLSNLKRISNSEKGNRTIEDNAVGENKSSGTKWKMNKIHNIVDSNDVNEENEIKTGGDEKDE